jgi:hypothetical protein
MEGCYTATNPVKDYTKMLEILKSTLDENNDNLPDWVNGPMPWHLQILLKDDLQVFEELNRHYGREKIKKMITTLEIRKSECEGKI